MKRTALIIPILLLSIACIKAQRIDSIAYPAAPVEPDSLLQKYRTMALDYNYDVKIAEKNIAASIELQKVANADFFPSLSAGADFKYTGNAMQIDANIDGVGPLSIQGTNMNYGFSATLSQPIFMGGKILSRLRMAQSDAAIARLESERLKALVCSQVDVQYWNTVACREMLEVSRDFEAAIEQLVKTVAERVELGLTDRQALLTAEVQLNDARYKVLQAENQYENSMMALNALIGIPLDSVIPTGDVVVELPVTPADMLNYSSIEARRPDLLIAEENIAKSKQQTKLHLSDILPKLSVEANGGFYSPGYDFRPDLSPNYAVYARLSVPLFDGMKHARQHKADKIRTSMAEDNRDKLSTDIDLEVQTALTSLDKATQRQSLSKASLDKARHNEALADDKYSEGLMSITEVIDARLYRQNAETNYVAAKAAAIMHYTEWIEAAHLYLFEE